MSSHHEIIIDDCEEPARLDRWLSKRFTHLSVSEIQKLMRKKFIRLNGSKATIDARVKNGDIVTMSSSGLTSGSHASRDTRVKHEHDYSQNKLLLTLCQNIIYKDDNIIVLNKPFGLATQGGSKVSISVDDLAEGLKFGLSTKPKLVHRIDKDTSGILLLARNDKAAKLLAHGFQHKLISKKYWAIVVGKPSKRSGVIDLPIAKGAVGTIEKVGVNHEDGKKAVTEYRLLDHASNKASWLEMIPITGRTHQLRVHAASLGTPILGDGKYGGKEAFITGCSNKLHLHAREISIPDFFGQDLHFVAPLSEHITASLEQLGLSTTHPLT